MSITVTIGTETFRIPSPNESPGWGEETTDWIEAISERIQGLSGSNDISITSATILDNQSSPVSISGFAFNTATVRAFLGDYWVTRTDGATVSTERGQIFGVYDGSTWSWEHSFVGDAGIDFSVTNAGQVQYYSSSIGGTYSGSIKFKASTFDA